MGWRPFSKEQEKSITQALVDAENKTSGELRVHVDRFCKTNPLLRAKNLFHHLKMDETELKNGVIIYVSMDDKQVAIFGDKGINEKVESDFWNTTLNKMIAQFKEGNMVEGIRAGLLEAGQRLSQHFPKTDDNKNELSDEISYG